MVRKGLVTNEEVLEEVEAVRGELEGKAREISWPLDTPRPVGDT